MSDRRKAWGTPGLPPEEVAADPSFHASEPTQPCPEEGCKLEAGHKGLHRGVIPRQSEPILRDEIAAFAGRLMCQHDKLGQYGRNIPDEKRPCPACSVRGASMAERLERLLRAVHSRRYFAADAAIRAALRDEARET